MAPLKDKGTEDTFGSETSVSVGLDAGNIFLGGWGSEERRRQKKRTRGRRWAQERVTHTHKVTVTHTGIRAHTDAHEYKTNTPTNTETHTNKSNTDVCVLLRVLSGMMTWKIIVYFSVEAGRLLEKKGKENKKSPGMEEKWWYPSLWNTSSGECNPNRCWSDPKLGFHWTCVVPCSADHRVDRLVHISQKLAPSHPRWSVKKNRRDKVLFQMITCMSYHTNEAKQ